jgi:hypothetical protein
VEVTASGTRDGKVFHATHLFLTSLRTTPEALLKLVRDRWSIEGWHWIRDTQLHEDAHRYRGNGAGALAPLRTAAMKLLRLGGFRSIRAGIQAVMHDITALLAMVRSRPAKNPCCDFESALGTSLEHAAHGLGAADVGVGDHQAHASEAALFEAAQELTPEGFALAVAPMQTEQLTPAVTVDAHGHDDGPGADQQRLAKQAVGIGRVEVKIRVTGALLRPHQERLDLLVEPMEDAAHLGARMPDCDPLAATRASTVLVGMSSGLIQSLSHGPLPALSAWVEVGGIAPSLCWKALPLQPILI